MPFTPFHMGVGLVSKGLSPRRVSILAFGASQVAVDCEPLFRALRHVNPIHGPVHTMLVGGAVGVAAGAVTWWIGRGIAPLLPAFLRHEIGRASCRERV